MQGSDSAGANWGGEGDESGEAANGRIFPFAEELFRNFGSGRRPGMQAGAEKAGRLPAYSANSFWIIRFNRSTVSE